MSDKKASDKKRKKFTKKVGFSCVLFDKTFSIHFLLFPCHGKQAVRAAASSSSSERLSFDVIGGHATLLFASIIFGFL